uniref:hypothetical protein n=1 Tax=Arsukibacterium sp. TaxID=1977258 RepID=UPI002FDB05EA
MQQPAWKSRALAALDQQARYELNSGYDEKESLIAVAAMKAWVQQNICPSKTEFLQQLEHYYQDIQANWAFPGKYSGGKRVYLRWRSCQK